MEVFNSPDPVVSNTVAALKGIPTRDELMEQLRKDVLVVTFKKLDGADPIKGDTSEEAGFKAEQGKEETPTDNVSVDHKPAPAGADKKEGPTDSDALFTKEVK